MILRISTLAFLALTFQAVAHASTILVPPQISQEQILRAVYNDFQVRSLPSEVADLPSTQSFQTLFKDAVLAAQAGKPIQSLVNIDVHIDFSQWPRLQDTSWGKPKRFILTEIIQRLSNQDPLLSRMLSDQEIIDASWKNYFKLSGTTAPEITLNIALDRIRSSKTLLGSELFAIDLGAGEGRDSLALLQAGFRVLAVEPYQEPLDVILTRARAIHAEKRLTTLQKTFQGMDLSQFPEQALLINASYSMPYAPRDEFLNRIWPQIVNKIQVGGYFAGQFFGDQDSFKGKQPIFTLSEPEVRALFSKFHFEYFQTIEEDGEMVNGDPKHWHYFDIVARKIAE